MLSGAKHQVPRVAREDKKLGKTKGLGIAGEYNGYLFLSKYPAMCPRQTVPAIAVSIQKHAS